MAPPERAGSPWWQQKAVAVLWPLLSRSRMEAPLNPCDPWLWIMSWAFSNKGGQFWKVSPQETKQNYYCPLLELRKLFFYLFYPLNSPVATLRLKFYILEAAVILWPLQVIPDHGKTPGMLLQWNWAGWGCQTTHPYPTGVPGRGDSHSLSLAAAIVSNSRRYWKDHFSQTNSTGGCWAEAPSHLLCIPKPWFHHPWWDFLEYASKEALFFTQCWYFHVPVLPDLLSKKKDLNVLKLLN